MSEYISLLATVDGPLQLYGSPKLNSHGDARVGWGIVGGAELEWTGETHNYLTVRYEDADVARTIKKMVMDRYPNRSALIASIKETRGLNGEICKIPHTLEDVESWGSNPTFSVYLRGYAHPLPAGLTSVGGYVYLRGYAHPLPAGLTSVGGYVYLEGYAHPLPAGLTSVGGYVYLEGRSITLKQYRAEFPAPAEAVATKKPKKTRARKKQK
jgi:hypothetical protein